MIDRYDALRAALARMKDTSSMVEATYWMAVIMRESETLLSERDSLMAALKTARHDLVCSEGLRATDQTLEQMNEKVSDGVPRSDLEFTIDNTKTLAVIDAALSGAK